MSKVCCVCGESKENAENRLFTCKGHGCDVTVHQGCYGIVTPPTGLWFCRKCESQERAARVRCELCPKKEGALKRTDSGSWAHVVCALYIPEVAFGNNRKMEPIITSKLPKERFTKSCCICEEKGLETQATYGACMACHKSSCRQAFHVTCAQKENLLCEEEDPRDPRNVIYCGYCSTHYKKMIRQKYKQTHRKQSVTPTSTTAPPFPPSSPPAGGFLPPSSVSLSHPSPLPSDSLLHSANRGIKERGAESSSHHTAAKNTKREKSSSGECPQKRLSTDTNPLPQPKRRRRTRKLSSSNESTTSEAPSICSDLQAIPSASGVMLGSPSSFVHSPPSIVVGGVGMMPTTSLLLSSASKERPFKQEVVEGESDVVSKMQVDMLGAGPLSPIQGTGGRRQPGSSTSSDNSNRSQAPPPRSLQELLERQWEQTAQFILDQAGKQNNAGSMLAHLHELQSENRSMQSRIMELASQREFYIAINTKLHQTLTEHNLTRLPNGVQPVAASGGGGASGDGLHPQQQPPQALAAISSGPALPHGGVGVYEEEEESGVQGGGALESDGSGLLLDTENSDERMLVSSSAIPKEAQDSLLQAHFSSMHRTGGGGGGGRRSKSANKHSSLQEHLQSDPMLSSVAELPTQQRSGGGSGRGYGGGHSRHSHDQLNSNLMNPLPSHIHQGVRGEGQSERRHHERHTERLAPSHPVMENNDRLAAPPSNEGGTPSLNEVTHVTAAVQRPIASFGSLPNDSSPMLSSTVGHPQQGSSAMYFNNPPS